MSILKNQIVTRSIGTINETLQIGQHLMNFAKSRFTIIDLTSTGVRLSNGNRELAFSRSAFCQMVLNKNFDQIAEPTMSSIIHARSVGGTRLIR